MIGAIVAAALWALAAGLILSLVLGVLVAAAVAATRPAAAARHALWSLALACAGIAPVLILAVMLARGHGAAPAPSAAAARPAAQIAVATQPARPAQRPAGRAALAVPAPPNLTPLVAQGIVAAWLVGALLGLGGLVRSLVRVRGLKLRSSPLDGALATELPWLTTTTGREIYLRLSYETETPIAVGFRRPVILLPTEMATAAGLTSIEPLIMHEYAHLARYDDWSNLAQRTIERLFWFNPLVWIIGRRIALEREVAADEAVVARTNDAKNYASALWRMAQEMRMPEHVVVAPGAMLTRKQISVRIERLLDDHPIGRRYAGASAFVLTAVALTGVAALAATAPPVLLPAPAPAPIAQSVEKAMLHRTNTETPPSNAPVSRDMVASCTGCDFSHRNLRGIDLSGLTLVGDDFDGADLQGANLRGARMQGDSFAHANLHGARMQSSKLTGVDFTSAVLDGADLSGAVLTGVDLSHASMNGTNTSGMRLIGSSLP